MPLPDDTWSLFRASPTPGYVIHPDAPHFTILEINEALLHVIGVERDTIIGKRLFEAFPDHSEDQGGQENLTASLNHVLKHKEMHQLELQQYDISKPGTDDFEVRYWSAQNTPVFNEEGAVCYILHTTEDITERVLIKQELQESEQHYQSLFEQNPDAVFSLNSEGYFTSVNPAAVQLVAYSEELLLGMHFSNLCLPEDLERVQNTLAECLNGRTAHIRVPAMTAAGKRLELHITAMPVMINGLITGVYGIAKDETEKLKENKERDLIAKMGDLFISKDDLTDCLQPLLHELCLYAGTQAAEVWLSSIDHTELNFSASCGINAALKADEYKVLNTVNGLIGAARDKREMVLMHDLQTNPEYFRTTFALDNKLQSGIAVPIIFKDQVIAVLTFYTLVPVPFDNVAVFTASLLDHLASHIQRKKAEYELNQYFNLSPDTLCILGYDGYFKKINPAFSKVLGYSKQEVLSKPFYEFVHPEDQEIVEQEYLNLKLGYQTQAFEVRYFANKGEVIWISWTAIRSEHERLIYCVARDVTEKKKLEKSIESEQQRFALMFNEAPVSMCILKGENHIYESANELYYKYTGTQSIIGKSVIEVFPEAKNQCVPGWLDQVYQTGETFSSYETSLKLNVKGTGLLQQFYLSFMFQAYRNNEGGIEGIFYFGVDVTEQVEARKRIEESEKQYADLIQNLPAAVYTTDTEGKILLYNKAAVELLGREPDKNEALFGGSLKILYPDGTTMPLEQYPMARTLKNGIPLKGDEILIERPDGSLRNVIPHPSPIFDTAGQMTGAINVLIDVTQSRQVNDELRKLSLIAKKTDNAVIITDPQGKIEWVNEAFTRITEYASDEVLGKTTSFLHGQETNKSVLSFMKEKSKRKQPFECEILKYTKSGNPIWLEIKHQPLLNKEGKLTHYFNLEADITDRKKAYEKVMQSESEIRRFARQQNTIMEEERARIAREIHDEFGQQLTGLKMSLSSLKKQFVSNPGNAEEVLTTVISDVDQSIQSLREFATELRPGILDTLGLFASIGWLAKDFEKKSGIVCSCNFKVNEEQFVNESLSICFFRICQEALTNVAKHSGASQVYLEMEQVSEMLSLKVTDNGKGIISDKINNPFSMGLLGMRERANLVGGELFITSYPDTKTTIHFLVNINNA